MSDPITAQPTAADGTTHPALQKLAEVDAVLVDQQFVLKSFIPNPILYREIKEDIEDKFKDVELPNEQTDWEGLKSYGFSNARGGSLFLATETRRRTFGCCCSCSASTFRNFQFHFWDESLDKKTGPAISVSRPFNVPCLTCCCLASAQRATVTSRGVVLGYVVQPFLGGIFTPRLHVQDAQGKRVLTVEGTFKIKPTDISVLKIKDASGAVVGEISRKQKKLSNDMKTDADFFAIRFPKDVSVAVKAALFAAIIFVDFVLFEGEGAATTVGTVKVEEGGQDLQLDVEERNLTRCDVCDLFCCGCMLRC